LRRRSAALVDEELLIDFGPDLMAAALMDGISLAKVRYCVQTHEHADHLDESHFLSRAPACDVHGPRLQYYATSGALAKASSRLGLPEGKSLRDPDAAEYYNLAANVIEPFQPFDAGPYRVHPVRAAHDPRNIVALLHLIERDGRALFYATDTGEIPEETWAYLAGWGRGAGKAIHVVAMDHTWGLNERVEGHMNWEQFTEQVARLRALNLLAGDARCFAHHIAHHGNPIHEELAAFAAGHGYEVAYDGLVVEF
jgi:phosphoribosyl 1,2-cyclic phosphate phosphodiesterase